MYIAPSFEYCPVCSSLMSCEDIDSRSEWCRCAYRCNTCDHTFSKLVTFKIQSAEVESEEWEDLPGVPHYEEEQRAYFMWNGQEERGRIWKRHVSDGAFHYHIDCPSVTSGTPPDTKREFVESELALKERSI